MRVELIGEVAVEENQSLWFTFQQATYMKVRHIIKQIEKDGWVMLPRTGTSHRQYVHPVKMGRVTIAGHRNDDVDREP